MDALSLVSDTGPYSSSCGYCKSEQESSRAHGMIADRLSAQEYQDLIDRGWRRSGCFLYKPDLSSSCCCLYTIRLDTAEFKPSKSQRKLLRRWQSFLAGNRVISEPQCTSEDSHMETERSEKSEPTDEDTDKNQLGSTLAQTINHCIATGSIRISSGMIDILRSSRVHSLSLQQQRLLGAGVCFTSPIAFTIAKVFKDKVASDLPSEAQRVAEIISSEFNSAPNQLFIASSLKGHINFKLRLPAQEYPPQVQAKGSKGDNAQRTRPVGSPHRFEMKMVPASFDQASFDLYLKYQVSQHGDEPDEVSSSSYKRFLVESPLFDQGEGEGIKCGSYHQQYWLDDQLIAVGVVDVLPRCLSSVYLFWDPDLSSLNLGKLTALLEIKWVQELNSNSLRYYYMGFFIPTCLKMKYKADYEPSDLLSPTSQLWVRLTDGIRSMLDSIERPFIELSEVPDAVTFPNLSMAADASDEGLDDVMICVNSTVLISWRDLKGRLRKRKQVEEIEQQLTIWRDKIGAGMKLCYSI